MRDWRNRQEACEASADWRPGLTASVAAFVNASLMRQSCLNQPRLTSGQLNSARPSRHVTVAVPSGHATSSTACRVDPTPPVTTTTTRLQSVPTCRLNTRMFRPLDRLFPSHAAETTALTMATAATAATASLCYPRASDPGDLSTRSPTRDPLGAPPAPVTGFGVGDPLTTGLLGPGQALLNHMLFPLSSGLPHPLPFPLHLPLPLPLSIPPLPFPLPMPLSLGHHSGLQTAHNSPPGHTDRPAWQPTMSEASRGVGATTTPIHFDDAVETTEACRHSISPSLFCALSAASPSSPLPPPPRATFAQATSLSTIFASRANLTPSTPPLSVWSPFAAGRLDCPPSSGSPGPATPRPFYALPPDELEPVVMRTASPSLYCRDDPKPNFSYIGESTTVMYYFLMRFCLRPYGVMQTTDFVTAFQDLTVYAP
ncbi:unnamed protein product [Protopolystoma xenopodis]|uniref:Uncharacterized protein n=1 Tax=Protopolystoma xenopodis TaxID=117903 RepID=A0A3S5BPX7_9PLAT|nr:unnamed protein product [Protopolystoma xenopodis]